MLTQKRAKQDRCSGTREVSIGKESCRIRLAQVPNLRYRSQRSRAEGDTRREKVCYQKRLQVWPLEV